MDVPSFPHEKNNETIVETAVADSKYGNIENYLACRDRGIKTHFSSLEETQKGTGTKKGIFPKEAFSYNAKTDTFTCPAGQILKRRKFFKSVDTMNIMPLRVHVTDANLKGGVRRPHPVEPSSAMSDKMI